MELWQWENPTKLNSMKTNDHTLVKYKELNWFIELITYLDVGGKNSVMGEITVQLSGSSLIMS